MITYPETRQYPRFAVQLEARLEASGRSSVVTTKDVSRGGICLVCPAEVTAGSDIKLALSLKLGSSAFSESLELEGRAIWCTPVGQRFQVGAVFTDMSPVKLGYLEMFLRFLQQEISLAESEPQTSDEKFDTGDDDDL